MWNRLTFCRISSTHQRKSYLFSPLKFSSCFSRLAAVNTVSKSCRLARCITLFQFYIKKRVAACRENMIPFLSSLPLSRTFLQSSFCIAFLLSRMIQIRFSPARRVAFPPFPRCIAVFLLLHDRLPSSRKLFLAAFFFPPPSFFPSLPSPLRCAACRVSLFLFCASISFSGELFSRVSTDMSFRSYLVLRMHIAVQTAGN